MTGGGLTDHGGRTGVAHRAAPVVTIPATGTSVDLTVERGGSRIAVFLVLACLVVTVLAAAVAYADPSRPTVGFALVMVVATVAVWRLWAGRDPVEVVATGSVLSIRRRGSRHVFDVADTRSEIHVIGLPGQRAWRVLFYRRGRAPYVVDGSMVDPAAFMRLLHRHRCEVHYRPR